jgi:hypothetical protein
MSSGQPDRRGRVHIGGPCAAHPSHRGFYAKKQLTTGEGGMVTLADPALKQRIDSERNQGRAPDIGWLDPDRLGSATASGSHSCSAWTGCSPTARGRPVPTGARRHRGARRRPVPRVRGRRRALARTAVLSRDETRPGGARVRAAACSARARLTATICFHLWQSARTPRVNRTESPPGSRVRQRRRLTLSGSAD